MGATRTRKIVTSFPEVVDFFRLSGDVDYLIRAVVPDIRAYDELYQRLIAKIDIYDVSSMFAMEQMKSTTELPLLYASTQNGRTAAQAARQGRSCQARHSFHSASCRSLQLILLLALRGRPSTKTTERSAL